jgi:hypothetical protein
MDIYGFRLAKPVLSSDCLVKTLKLKVIRAEYHIMGLLVVHTKTGNRWLGYQHPKIITGKA